MMDTAGIPTGPKIATMSPGLSIFIPTPISVAGAPLKEKLVSLAIEMC